MRPLKKPSSRPTSSDLVISGLRFAFAIVLSRPKSGKPENFRESPLYTVCSLYGSASVPTFAIEARIFANESVLDRSAGIASVSTKDRLPDGYTYELFPLGSVEETSLRTVPSRVTHPPYVAEAEPNTLLTRRRESFCASDGVIAAFETL